MEVTKFSEHRAGNSSSDSSFADDFTILLKGTAYIKKPKSIFEEFKKLSGHQ